MEPTQDTPKKTSPKAVRTSKGTSKDSKPAQLPQYGWCGTCNDDIAQQHQRKSTETPKKS